MNRRSDIGWFELIVGIILIIFGVVIMRQPVGVLTWIVILCGVLAILSGIGDIVLYVKMEHFTGWTDSFTCHRNPECDGRFYARGTSGSRKLGDCNDSSNLDYCALYFRLSHLQYMKMHYGMTYYTISLILNILGLLVGILLIFRPMITILSMGVLVGGFMIIEGVELILVGWTADNITDKKEIQVTGGSGIGLSVAKAIVQAHKGKITQKIKTKRIVTITILL